MKHELLIRFEENANGDVKPLLREISNIKEISKEDAFSLLQPLRDLQNSTDVSIRMLTRACFGRLNDLFPEFKLQEELMGKSSSSNGDPIKTASGGISNPTCKDLANSEIIPDEPAISATQNENVPQLKIPEFIPAELILDEILVGDEKPEFVPIIKRNLFENEQIIARCYCLSEVLVATTEKVMIIKIGSAKAAVQNKPGFSRVGNAIGGNGLFGLLSTIAGAAIDYSISSTGELVKCFEYHSISSIECTNGMIFGHLQIIMPGATEIKNQSFSDAAHSDNVVQFPKKNYDQMLQVSNLIRQKVKSAHHLPTTNNTESIPDLIKKLADLRDQGILSEEEFLFKKNELLKKM